MKTKDTVKSKPLLVSPSGWMVWTKCAASLLADHSPFKVEDDVYADAGTKLHREIALELDGALVDEKVEEDDAAIIRFAVETVRNISTNYITEYKMSSVVAGILFQGTSDCVIEDGDTVIIIDHKTGWKEVEAEGNIQLKTYAHLYAAKNKKIKNWKGIIINARFNSVSYAEGGKIDKMYLKNLAADTKKRITEKQIAVGNHCGYCNRLTTCKKVRVAIEKWLAPGAADSITRQPEKLAEALRLAKPAEKLFDGLKKEAQLFIDLGGVIPGVTVEYTSGTRCWSRDLSVEAIAEKIGLPVDKMSTVSTISPAEATRRGADKEAINAIAIRPPRKGFKFN